MEEFISADEGIRKIRKIASRWLTPGHGPKARDAMSEITAVLMDVTHDPLEVITIDPQPTELDLAMLRAAEPGLFFGDATDQPTKFADLVPAEPSPALLDVGVPAEHQWFSQAALDVTAERRRQIEVEGWTPEHDDEHASDEIAAYACLYAMPPAARDWDATSSGYGATFGVAMLPSGWGCKLGDRRRELVKAGALILAEIERLDRETAASMSKCNWDEAPSWADKFGRNTGGSHVWYSDHRYAYCSNGVEYSISTDGISKFGHTYSLDEITLIASRPAVTQPELYTTIDEARMDVIGQNGNDGEHYEAPAVDDDGWIEWVSQKDGTCPVEDGVLVDVRYRDGTMMLGIPALETIPGSHDASKSYWDTDHVQLDIVAYRLTKADTPAS